MQRTELASLYKACLLYTSVCEIDGESTAQVMVIAGCGNGSSIALPNWRLNLRFEMCIRDSSQSEPVKIGVCT